ncbi:hypothetical protein J4Q44_G00334320 [Coregonus suidteri]|uniref:Uncharacterized protein n=1 Tax=Coregonus suidteri TaxID=861788 RepID=A0AAN8KJ57_9TELE
MCPVPHRCEAPNRIALYIDLPDEEPPFIPVLNLRARNESFPYEFTVCISPMFDFDNILLLEKPKGAAFKLPCDYETGVGIGKTRPVQYCTLFYHHNEPNLSFLQRDPHQPLNSDNEEDISGSKTFVLNAFFEHRTHNMSIRLISIVWRPENTIHHCLMCCQGRLVTSLAKQTIHNSHFWFPYGTGDFLCDIPEDCEPTHAGLVSEEFDPEHITVVPILNRVPRESGFPVNFTVCLSTMFGGV